MRTLGLVLALLATPLLTAYAQEPAVTDGVTISSAQVTGLDLARLSPGLQQEIGGLAGGPLNQQRLRELSARIEEEQPRFVAAARAVRDPDGEVRVVFVVAHRRDKDRQDNVNARYIIEHVDIRGVSEDRLGQQLRDDLQALVGRRLDSDEVERFETGLRSAFPDHEVRRSIVRGSQSGQIRLMFVMSKGESAQWLHFEPLRANFVYHSEQGWGALLGFPLSSSNVRLTPIVAIDNGDDLIEEYSGFGLRFETRKLVTERLGASLEWSRFDQTWRDATLSALDLNSRLPAAYQTRSTITPLVAFAFTPQLMARFGVSVSELEPLTDAVPSQMANAAIASIGYDQRWELASGASHDLDAAFTVRAASERLESDFTYTRYLAQGEYRYRRAKHLVLLSGMGGTINRDAPLFERFSLGDSHTLRGWNKYDIAPTGGDRMFHTSLEYRYRDLAFFLDSGSVWDRGTDRRVRVATGVGFHSGPVFLTVGFPLNADQVSAVFTMGIRFSGIGIQKY